ncbi:MAG: DNA (cytosine-5-)-methyltransferase [Lentisphaeria bacterium]|nr:DNA (cytosine-5-)-methyltransferase [Lentisphaeria bacterium]
MTEIRYIDLFCGIGGFRLAAEGAAAEGGLSLRCALSSDIDTACQDSYEANFGERPVGDISQVEAADIPAHDLLLAGFPCQPFSIMGSRRGFDDTRGTLFFEIARILEAKRPAAFVLENVKMLRGHNKGQTLRRILEALQNLGYTCEYRILNALDFGLPQKRERLFIVGFRDLHLFQWPVGDAPMRPLSEILERDVPEKYQASPYIRERRRRQHAKTDEPTIWHENKSGHISAYPYSCALRAGASYNYLLVNGERRLTPREMLRLQGFPDSYEIVSSDNQTRKQAGNSLPVPVAQEILVRLFDSLGWCGRPLTSDRGGQ